MAAVSQDAQGMQTAMTSTNPLAVVPRDDAINQTLQQRAATPSTTTPAGVPAPAPTFTGQQAVQTAVKTITSGIQAQTKKNPQGFLNRLTGAQPSQVITPKTLATRPTAQRSQLALGR